MFRVGGSCNFPMLCAQFLSFKWTRLQKHYKYVEIKHFIKEEIKQNNISTVTLLIKALLFQWNTHHLQWICVVYIFVYITKSKISNNICGYINHYDIFYSDKWCAQRLIESIITDEKNKTESTNWGQFYFINAWINRWCCILNSVFD